MEYMNALIEEIQKRLNIIIVDSTIPPQGMGSSVVFLKDENSNEYAIKQSEENNNDANVLRILQQSNVDLAVPKLIDSFTFEGKSIVILEKISAPLLETIEGMEMSKYIPSMVENLEKLHRVKSDKAGYLNSHQKYNLWKDFLLSFFNGDNSNLDWVKISKREGLDKQLILDSIDKIIEVISKNKFIDSNYSLLNSDFNQRNLFVNSETDELAAIIDWGEAMYGDPIYDFARIRMYIWHFNLGDKAIHEYYKLMNYTKAEKKLDTLYWLSRVIEYLAYYSEELNEFSTRRIRLHQEFLRDFDWDIFN